MVENAAAEPAIKLPGLTPRMQAAIEDQLVALTQGLTNCLDRAQSVKPQSAYDETRSHERHDAVQLVDATSTLLKAVSSLRGEFRHNYNVMRLDAEATARPKWPAPEGYNTRTYPYLSDEQVRVLSTKDYEAYQDVLDALPTIRSSGLSKSSVTEDGIARLEGEVNRVARTAGPPTPSPAENCGSNTEKAANDGNA